MFKDNMLILTVFFCLCIMTRPLSAKTLVAETSFAQKATVNPSVTSEAPAKAQNVSIQVTMQKNTNTSLKAPGGLEHLTSSLSKLVRIPLSMSVDSVDDMYYGCSQKMLIKVKRHYLPRRTREGLHSTHTKLCALKAMRNMDVYDPLSWNHFRALCSYTAGAYDDFNRAVRKGKTSYKTSFEFHALHFLLSDAIRLLKLNQRNCYTAYRRSKLLFIGEPGQTIRFGSFASSSLNKDLRQFGSKTCFEIKTCFGAYLKFYSEFDSDEDEVLIPPHEMFTIVSVDMSGDNELHCDVFYKLETAGVYSRLNCQDVDL
ncbi:NAD(P)(+)--arginine ADP-ribosyltransferase 2-like [Thunnus thynnus]|uniref:NAD(P)(+)--arginine ADP-ribosyltransferase 2-like n=1 Tax=Thunnus thynnus TaxID=8237 RepID=UPI003528AEF5